jgi:hypothetical protein
MQQPATEILSLGQPHWTDALLQGFPISYSGAASRLPGGGVYGMFNGIATNLQFINDFLVYAFDACRIETAVGMALDLAAADYYGILGLPRKTGESDDSYRARILAGLFIPYTTKQAFIQAITALTGVPPVLIAPWKASETSAYDWSYYDVNIPGRPGLYGDPGLAYQVFIQAQLPSPTGQAQATAIWGYDAGAGYDVYTGTYWNLVAANFIGQADLDALILRIKAFGIIVWRKYLSANSTPFPIPVSSHVAPGQAVFPISIQPFNGQYIVIADGNWNSSYWVDNITSTGFTINASSVSPVGGIINYVIIPITQPEVIEGVGNVILDIGATTAAIPAPVLPATPGNRVALTPSWNSSPHIVSITGSAINISFNEPAPPGATISYFFAPDSNSALQNLTAGDIASNSIFISIPGIPPCCPFVTPSWNCEVAPMVVSGGIQAFFSETPPDGAFVTWAFFPLAGG